MACIVFASLISTLYNVIILHIGFQIVISILAAIWKWVYAKSILKVFNAVVIAVNFMKWSAVLTRGETTPLLITTPLAPVGPLWPKVFVGPTKPGRWPRGSTDEAQSSPESDSGNATALACTGTAFGPAVETRLERTKEGKHQDQMVWHQSVWNPVLTSWPPSSHRS